LSTTLTGAPAASPVVSRFSSMARQQAAAPRRAKAAAAPRSRCSLPLPRRAHVAAAAAAADAWPLHEAAMAPRAGSSVGARRRGIDDDDDDAIMAPWPLEARD
jgi:hypothetical protein